MFGLHYGYHRQMLEIIYGIYVEIYVPNSYFLTEKYRSFYDSNILNIGIIVYLDKMPKFFIFIFVYSSHRSHAEKHLFACF